MIRRRLVPAFLMMLSVTFGFWGVATFVPTYVGTVATKRAAIEFRGLPTAVRDELVGALGDKITVQESDWNWAGSSSPTTKKSHSTIPGCAAH